MEIREIQAIVESLLFAAGEAVELEKIADIVDVDKKSLREIIKKMMDTYNYEKRGIHIIKLEDSYRMCTRGEYKDYVSMLMKPGRKLQLSNAAIEVLAIVAYKQPVTRATIEHIRGVNCDYIVNWLKDAPGRPILFGTTKEFLQTFGIESISDLPEFESLAVPEDTDMEQMTIDEKQEQLEFNSAVSEEAAVTETSDKNIENAGE